MVWHVLDEPLILAACAGAGSAALSAARRYRRARSRVAYRPLLAAACESCLVGASLSLVALHFLPSDPRAALGGTIVLSWVYDFAADETRSEWRSIIKARVMAALRAMLEPRDD